MNKIEIPPIYEENIIEFVFSGFIINFKYCYGNTIVNLNFDSVYQFDFCEFDYIKDIDWEFGLTQYSQSPLLEDLYSRVPTERRNRAFGGEPYKLQHYMLVVDDVGIYNIICKSYQVEETIQMTM